jgi:orotate phosphoribosyltransferase
VATTLIRHLLANAVRVGDFVVGDHRTSWFVDVPKTACDPKGMLLVADSLLSVIPDDIDALGGPAPSANPIVFATCAIAATRGRALRSFVVSTDVTGASHISGTLQSGDRVVITDSAAFDGDSLARTVRCVRTARADPALCAVLFDGSGVWQRSLSAEGIDHLALVNASDLGLSYPNP